MIIRPRMPRILNRRSRTGILGLRSLQRSVVHVRRMVISRLPEHAPEDIQSAIDQPLVWSDHQSLLTGPTEPVTLDAGRRRSTSTPFHQPNQSAQPGQRVQRAPDQTEPETMPKDLQAIFNFHRDKGNVNPQASFMDRIRDDLVSQGKPASTKSTRPGASPTPSTPPPAQQPVQRQPADDDFPIVVEPPPPRRVRSRVEYVKPEQTATPSVQKQSDQNSESSDDDPSLLSSSTEQPIDEIPFDLADDLPDAMPGSFDMDPVDQAIARAEAPSGPPQVSLSRDDADLADDSPQAYHADYQDEPEADNAVDQAITRAEAPNNPPQISLSRDEYQDESAEANAVDQAITRAEAPSSPPQVSLSRDDADLAYDDVDEPYYDEPHDDYQDESATSSALDQAIARAEAPAPQVSLSRDDEENFATVLDIPTEPESPSDESSSIGQRPRKLTVSNATPPMQIQPLRIKTPGDEEESFLDSANDDSNIDDGGEDNATADMAPAEEETAAGDVQMMRDDIGYYSAPEPDALPEQSVDLGAALFGGSQLPPAQVQPSVQRRPDNGPTPTVMPPIGSTQHKSSPQSFVRREIDRQAALDAHIQRAEAPSEDDTDFRAPTDEETGLLSLLDMPEDTPIQQSGGESMPNIQASREQEIDVQRAVETGEVTSEVEGGDNEGDSESSSNEPNSEDVKKMANQVYSLIKRRLKIEQQRLGGRK